MNTFGNRSIDGITNQVMHWIFNTDFFCTQIGRQNLALLAGFQYNFM